MPKVEPKYPARMLLKLEQELADWIAAKSVRDGRSKTETVRRILRAARGKGG